MKVFLALVLCVFYGCGKADEKPEPETPTDPIVELRTATVNRLVQNHIENFAVVSRHPDGLPEHEGEGLIWAGVALQSLTCEEGFFLELAVRDMITRHGGALVRFEPLGEYAGGREITADGAIGLYAGVAARIKKCPETIAFWSETMRLHKDFLDSHRGALHPNVVAKVPAEFTFSRDLLFHKLGLAGSPDSDRAHVLESQLVVWAWGVKQTKSACFRLNLSLLAVDTIESLDGSLSQNFRNLWCAATDGTDVPLIDHWCGRKSITEYVATFKQNEWEYRHQRCGAWETPDGDGLTTPSLDLLRALSVGYGF